MKAVFVASLILSVSSVAFGMEFPQHQGYKEGIDALQGALHKAIHTPLSRDFKPAGSSCPHTCQETAFFLPAVQALQYCTAAQASLGAGIATAVATGNNSLIDSTWATFCDGSCFSAANDIPAEYYCCLGDAGGAFFGLKKGCSTNANTGRLCGAELLNLGGIACGNANTTEAQCPSAGTSCEWVSTEFRCAFKPVATVLNGLCSSCITEYIDTFSGGGIESATTRNSVVGAYTSVCNKIQGDYCSIVGGYNYQFRKPDQLTNAELTDLCMDTDASVKKRLCYKQVQTSIAAGLRSSIQGAYALCLAGGMDASTCTTAAGGTAVASIALDRSVSMMCSRNPNTTTYCLSLDQQAGFGTSCFAASLAGNCTAECATEFSATATAAGCCLGALATSGQAITSTLNSQMRLMSDARAVTFSGVLNRSAGIPYISDAVFNVVIDKTTDLAQYSPLAGFATCAASSTMPPNITLSSVSTQCFNPVPSKTLTLTLQLNIAYAAVTNASVPAILNNVKERITTDLSNRLGIAAASVVSITASASATRKISAGGVTDVIATDFAVVLNIGSTAEVAMLKLEVAAQVAASSLSMPLLATELAVNCPTCISNTYSSVVVSAAVTEDDSTDGGGGGGGTDGAASQTLMVAITALVALIATLM